VSRFYTSKARHSNALAQFLQTWLVEAVPRHGSVCPLYVRRAVFGMPTNRKRTRPTSPKAQATLSQLQRVYPALHFSRARGWCSGGAGGRCSLLNMPRMNLHLGRHAQAWPHDDVFRAFNTASDALSECGRRSLPRTEALERTRKHGNNTSCDRAKDQTS
jgi:hypothetical protein